MTAVEILDWFTRRLIIRKSDFPSGPYGTLEMNFVLAEPPNHLSPDEPITYVLVGPANSYTEACLGEIGLMLDEARRLLGKPTTPDAEERAAAIVVSNKGEVGIAKG
jgi:hypothetical protein